jgi:cytochrome P450
MRTCLFYVCRTPGVYRRLQAEIDDFYDTNSLQEPIAYTQALTLPYLQAVIKEATRLLPSIVYQLLRIVPAGGLTVDGKYIPEGSVVGISPISQNRDKAIWGEDADVFRPERWTEDEARGRYLEGMSMTFGGNGPRACIGKNIALVSATPRLVFLLSTANIHISN